ncbi:putative quinol monooxygenase [Sphingomonas immobilis]|uniref:Quinol monooxygenase n=1 Tax=Sphingomonas immobilis TaxID=3063997 RepID=A0ABT8ZXC9_9SPHN|nr:putative quinol monooxygenase [Sphingomonas sp. CA1-15]MDO7842216.1 putative quinol monooxygenase [Sphingomonas sp. CA1-15]
MIAIIASFTVPEDKAEAFEAIAGELVAATNANEPGVKLYTLARDKKDPTQYRMMELYEDQAAVDTHMASDWFKAAGPKLGGVLDGRPKIEQFTVVA